MADNEKENREEEVNENGGRADAFKPLTSNDAGTDHEAVQYFDEDDPNGEYRDAQTDILEDKNALKKEQDRQFVERGMERTNDPLSTSYGALEANRTTNLHDAAKNEVVVGTGMRLADDRSWEARYNAMQARKRAERQDLKNSSMARQELLNTGRYFDDGRGNIKLKQSERKTRERLGRGWHEETTADNGFGNWYVNGGWKQALDAQNAEKASASKKKMSDFISLNRQSLKEIETARKEKDVNSAKAKFALFGGIAAAYDALKNELANTDESSFTPEKAWALGKDAKGNVTTGDMQNTGKYMKRGFVTGKALQSLNQEIKSYGGDYQVVGLMAQQKFNDVKGSAYGKPMIIARIKRFDEATGTPVYSDEVFSLDRAYRMGMDFGEKGGVSDYKNLVWDGIGDIHGEQKRAIEAATAKDRAKLAIEQEKQKGLAARNDANIAAKERMNEADNKTRLDIAAIRERTLERKKTSDPKFDEKHYNALAARLDSLTKDSDGNDRDPATMTDADRKKAEAIQTAMDDMLFGKVNTGGAGDHQGAESAAGGANAAQAATWNSVIDAKRNELIRRGVLNQDGTPRTDGVAQPQAAQGQQAQAQQPPVTGNAQQTNTQNVGKQSGAAIVEQFGKKGETANATSQANNEKQSGSGKEQDIDLSDVQDGIDRSAAGADDVYRTIPREIIKRVKDATGASDEEIMSGKYDRQIEALGARVGNDSVKGISDKRKAAERNLEAIKGKRKAEAKQEDFRKRQMAFTSDRKDMEKKARDEAEKYGVAHGYDDSQIEKRASTSIRRGLIELRDKYGLAADGSQDYMVSKK